MELEQLIQHPVVDAIITHPDDDSAVWRDDLQRFVAGDHSLTRKSAGESAITAVQRLIIFLGYSTSSSGAFSIDGDFGRGTNRGVAQFLVEAGLSRSIAREDLCYPCRYNTARRLITQVPEARLTARALKAMALAAIEQADAGRVITGNFDDAIFQLNALHKRRYLNCRQTLDRYGDAALAASAEVAERYDRDVRPEWVLSIIQQETAGIIRPRFEQHYLSRLNAKHPDADLFELRMQSMSMGLGQIMGSNYKRVGAASATELFVADERQQVAFVARFLRNKSAHVGKAQPREADFHAVAKHYNGPKYADHHYHERIARWFREFRHLL